MPKNILRYTMIIILVIIFSFSYGYLKTLFSMRNPGKTNTPIVEQEALNIPSQEKLNPGAKLIYFTYYAGCGHELIEEKILDDKYVGLTRSQFQEEIKGWEIESFSPTEVKLRKEVPGVCDNHYYIGIHNGYVSLFQGIPGIQSTLIEQTDIIAATLRGDDIQILERGLIIKDRQEFYKIKEGLTN